jgi:hypothetical protein
MTSNSPKTPSNALARADLELAPHLDSETAKSSVAKNEHEKTGYSLEARPIRWTTLPISGDTRPVLRAKQP